MPAPAPAPCRSGAVVVWPDEADAKEAKTAAVPTQIKAKRKAKAGPAKLKIINQGERQFDGKGDAQALGRKLWRDLMRNGKADHEFVHEDDFIDVRQALYAHGHEAGRSLQTKRKGDHKLHLHVAFRPDADAQLINHVNN